MTDIVERLRKVDFETRPFWSSNTIRDAIAEIAALSAKLAEAERDRDAVMRSAQAAHDADAKAFLAANFRAEAAENRVAELEKELDETATTCGYWRDRSVATEARVAELEKALEPFAEAAETAQKLADLHGANEFVLSFGPAPIGVIPLGCFSEARAALAAKEPKP